MELYRALGSSVDAHKAVLAAHPMYANLMERALAKVVLQHVTTLEKFCQVLHHLELVCLQLSSQWHCWLIHSRTKFGLSHSCWQIATVAVTLFDKFTQLSQTEQLLYQVCNKRCAWPNIDAAALQTSVLTA